jgi:predicted CoA-substrate-specific enzyme activase
MITAGIDGGSRAVKVVVFDRDARRVLGSGRRDQGVKHEKIASDLLDEVLGRAGISRDDLELIVATGYTRNGISFADRTVTEISCHAAGVSFLCPGTRTVIEIGGQDSKVLHLEENGAVRDFAMNDRCAAGTGRFLEVVAEKLEADLSELGEMAAGCECPASISSMCVVFAETEIIGLLSSGRPREEIVAGVQESMVRRVAALAGRRVTEPIVFTGGVALVPGMREALEAALGRPVVPCPDPLYTGALGAALAEPGSSRPI